MIECVCVEQDVMWIDRMHVCVEHEDIMWIDIMCVVDYVETVGPVRCKYAQKQREFCGYASFSLNEI